MALLPLLLLLRLVTSAAASTPATALFVLGDSTSSCAATTLPLNLSSSSSGPCLFPSNRRLLPDILAGKMGLPPPPLVSTLNGSAAAAAKGVNFGGEEGERGIFRMGAVGQQLRLATEMLQLLRLEAATPQDAAAGVAGAVFVLSFGTDAYARLLARGSEADASAPKHGRRGFGRLLADRVARTVSELYEADVRRVAVMGAAPLGCAPRVMWEGLHLLDGRSCVEEANELIQGYNTRLAAQLDALRPQLPGADIVFCDIYKGMMEMITNPGSYGFDEAREACCGLGPFGGTIGCLSREMVCPTPQRHVWWDLYSPTEAVNSLLASWSWSAPPPAPGSSNPNTSICHPVILQQLAGGHGHGSPSLAGVASTTNCRCQVGLKELPKDSPLGRFRGSDNVVEIYSRCYESSPLVIQGAGVGNDTTAAGVLADIIDLQNLFQKRAWIHDCALLASES